MHLISTDSNAARQSSPGVVAAPLDIHPQPEEEARRALAELLLGGAAEGAELPQPPALHSAVLSLAEGARRKIRLPLGGSPAELVLVRRGRELLVTYYFTDGAPEVRVLDRAVPLFPLLDACSAATREHLSHLSEAMAGCGPLPFGMGSESDQQARELAQRLLERAGRATVKELRPLAAPVEKRVGALSDPGEDCALAFGFWAAFPCTTELPKAGTAKADLHALLFPGELWAYSRGRRSLLAKGPISLVIERLIAALRGVIDAWELGREAHLRLRSGSFGVGLRLRLGAGASKSAGRSAGRGSARVELRMKGEQGSLVLPELGIAEVGAPILRLASDFLRALVGTDRAQIRNLRVSALREEVRALRRAIRDRARSAGFVNADPDRLRVSLPPPPPESEASDADAAPRTLRFRERWRGVVDGLSARSTFLCGDRIVVASPQRSMAISREEGGLLWEREAPPSTALMAGATLVRVALDGKVELSDIEDGDTFATARIAPRTHGAVRGLYAHGPDIPPVMVLTEGRNRLVAIDLRTGELRWRFYGRGDGSFRLRRVGRVLLCVSGDPYLSAIDLATGEVVWRFASEERFCFEPIVVRDVVAAVTGGPSAGDGTLSGIDLYTGRELYRRPLDGPPACAPIHVGNLAGVSIGGARYGSLAAFSPESGSLRWMVPDPGLSLGAEAMTVDRSLLINAPTGRVEALSLETGRLCWSRRLAHPVEDDIPRRLEPVLRSGALFVPSAAVHVLRPSDGSSIGEPLPGSILPDWLRVDERGWVYVAEESGHLMAFAPVPHLSLVR